MFTVRHAAERGHIDMGWLDTYHTFSFGRYVDRAHMGYGPLRVINDDRVAGGKGFDAHPHDNMEIITYVLSGALAHRDSMGNGSVIKPGDVQHMSAGTGITHSEFNASETEGVHLLQIWILPQKRDIAPVYGQVHFSAEEKRGRLCLVASGDGRDGSIPINQDADMYASLIDGAETVTHALRKSRKGWVQVARGNLTCNGRPMKAGDGAAIEDEDIVLEKGTDAEVIVFDMSA
jgi:quercetin 2,3-dioxygenase